MHKMMFRRYFPPLVALCAAVLTVAATQPPNLVKAIDAQKALVEQRPTDSAALNDLGNLYRLAERFDDAVTAYERAIELDPKKVPSRYNLALLLEQVGKRNQALKQLEEVVDLDPGYAWAHYQIGAILEAKGNNSAAVNAYARAFALNPELAQPKVNPQVIDNELVTEALLKAYRKSSVTPNALNTYEDPNHIASLFVPPAKPRSEGAEAAPRQASAAEKRPPGVAGPKAGAAGASAAKRAGPRPAGGGADLGEASARVLTEEDLEGRHTGQVAGSKPVPGRGGSRTPTITQPTRTWAAGAGYPVAGADKGKVPAEGAPSVTRPGSSRGTTPVAPGLVRPGAAQPFRPGLDSTGQFRSQTGNSGFGQPRPSGQDPDG